MRPAGLLALVVLAGAACTSSTGSGYVTVQEIQRHPEASLTYPGATNVTHMSDSELDTPDTFGQGPRPASTTTRFYTQDRIDRVIAWYDAWLSAHGWMDAVEQGNGNRRWERTRSEEFYVDCSYQDPDGRRVCLAAYTLRSPRFGAKVAPAPAFGDPVAEATVRSRSVGLEAVEGGLQYLSGPPIPMEGTPAAQAARARWPQGVCCASPVMLDDSAMAESPTRSAYHATLLEVAEYNRPDVSGGAFGNIERKEMLNLENSGFLLENVGLVGLNGASANVYVYERGLREAVILSVSYGPAMAAAQGIAYRVATVQIVYDVAPRSCDLSRPDCFDILAGTANVVWSHA